MTTGFHNHQSTYKNVDRNFVEWHQGRPYYYIWAVMIDEPCWLKQLTLSQRLLTSYLVEGYARQAHISLLPAGFLRPNSLSMEAIIGLVTQYVAFDIELGPLDSFTGSPYHQIKDPTGQLTALRKAFRPIAADPNSKVEDTQYVPHLTVGLYNDVYPLLDIGTGLVVDSTSTQCPPVTITSLSLIRYQTQTIKGPLEEVGRFDFEGRAPRILDPSLFTFN